jgi:hypothetical protein
VRDRLGLPANHGGLPALLCTRRQFVHFQSQQSAPKARGRPCHAGGEATADAVLSNVSSLLYESVFCVLILVENLILCVRNEHVSALCVWWVAL